MLIISTQADLDTLTKSLVTEPVIGLDTEFERQYYYYPRLSTIQIVTENCNCIIDYLSLTRNKFNLESFREVIYNRNCIKIFHSCRQDLEIFYNLFHEIPPSIFDTQIAANICGLGKTISYSNLCFSQLSEIIDKQYQHANWLERPLPVPMIEYALNDVRHLLKLYKKLNKLLIDRQLINLFQNSMNKVLDINNFEFNPVNSWKKVKFTKQSSWEVTRMKKIAALREELAKDKNIPRRHFATDEDLVKLCKKLPTTKKELEQANLTKNHFVIPEYCDKLFKVCYQLRSKKYSK